MAWQRIFESTVVGTGTGGSTQTVTVPFSAVTGDNCLAVLTGTARNTGTTFSISATFDGNAMSMDAEATAALGGFGEGSASIFSYAAGDLSSASGNAVFTISGSDGDTGRIATLAIYSDIEQVTPLRATATDTFVSATTSASVAVTSASTDLAVDCITFGTQNVSPVEGAGQTLVGNDENGTGNGDACEHASSEEMGGSTSTTMSWTFASSAFSLAAATYKEATGTGDPVITSVVPAGGAGKPVRPNEKDIAINGTDFNPGGTTAVYLTAMSAFSDPKKRGQTISGITATTINWDEVDMGSMPEGRVYLWVVTDEGGPQERLSAPFELILGYPDVHWAKVDYVTDGGTGVKTVASGLKFKPRGAYIMVTGNTALETIEAPMELSNCIVSETTAMGIGCGSDDPAGAVKRQQISGAGALFVMDADVTANPDHVVGTPSLTDDGMDVDFTTNASGYHLLIIFVGGNTVQAECAEITMSDGSYVGLGFEPELLIGLTSMQTAGATSDSSFSRQCVGISVGATTNQHMMAMDADGAARNTSIQESVFLAQLNDQANTWAIDVSSLDSDGFSWNQTGTGLGDGGYVLAVRLDGAKTFIDHFITTQSLDNDEENLPDSGIDEPGILILQCAARSTPGPTGLAGGRWAMGVCMEDEDQAGITAVYVPPTSTADTECHHSHTDAISNTSVGSDLTLETRVVVFGRTPRLKYIDNPTSGIRYNVFMAEELSSADEDGAAADVC